MSALIFVAVAVAWVVYLVPKALRHHEEASASRTVEEVSDRARVLARRDAVSARATALVAKRTTTTAAAVADTDAADTGNPETEKDAPAGFLARRRAARAERSAERQAARAAAAEAAARTTSTPELARRRRAAARRAAQRRRRVLITLLVAVAATAGVAIAGLIATAWIAVPAALVVAWLVACRLMVRAEHTARPAAARVAAATDDASEVAAPDAETGDETDEIAAVIDDAEPPAPAPGTWEPVPVTLPTYVDKAAANRTVRTIDLDSTGVWSSGRNADDSQLAREAEAQGRADREARSEAETEQRRASGD